MKKTRRLILILLFICAVLAQAAQEPKPAEYVVTKELLLQRIEQLQHAREEAIAQVNALGGAIQECQYWLGQIESAEAKAKAEAEKAKPKEH